MTKKRAKYRNGLVGIGGRENHDKELFNGTGTEVGLQIWSGLAE